MAETKSGTRVNIPRLILIPSVITLAVTVLRLVGELNNWSDFWFNRTAGGGGSPIGISWLAPIFGIYFALKLSREGEGPSSIIRAILFPFLSIAVVFVAALISFAVTPQQGNPVSAALLGVLGIIAILILRKPWPALFKTLLAYGYAARIPVAIVMLFAIYGNWGTHYDVPPPGGDFPAMHWAMKWLVIGAIPQLIMWILVTIASGLLFGSIAVALAHRGKQPARTAHA